MKFIVVIPARYKSTRLPGKPLIEICGLPMIVRTYRQCIKVVSPQLVYVATDDHKIAEVCDLYGIQYMMTSSDCLTGTDRVFEVSKSVDADCYINVQGDEPLFNPRDITLLIESAKKYPSDIINGFCEIDEEEKFRSLSIPKVVLRPDGRLLYMSRGAIPSNKEDTFISAKRQVCAYAFPKDALRDFANARNKTFLEGVEDIEILRFLELGFDIRMIEMSNYSVSIDTPLDIIVVEEELRKLRAGL